METQTQVEQVEENEEDRCERLKREHYEEIIEVQSEVSVARSTYLSAKEMASEKKKRYEGDALNEIVLEAEVGTDEGDEDDGEVE